MNPLNCALIVVGSVLVGTAGRFVHASQLNSAEEGSLGGSVGNAKGSPDTFGNVVCLNPENSSSTGEYADHRNTEGCPYMSMAPKGTNTRVSNASLSTQPRRAHILYSDDKRMMQSSVYDSQSMPFMGLSDRFAQSNVSSSNYSRVRSSNDSQRLSFTAVSKESKKDKKGKKEKEIKTVNLPGFNHYMPSRKSRAVEEEDVEEQNERDEFEAQNYEQEMERVEDMYECEEEQDNGE
jgi:hypothetical protein